MTALIFTLSFFFSDVRSLQPNWTQAVQFRDEFFKDKICAFSKGFRPINNNAVELKLCDDGRIEGVRWSRGFKKGRHVIEFIYPVHLRAPGSRVGLGGITTPLGGTATEVIGANDSYAVDLIKNRAITENKAFKKLPRSKVLGYLSQMPLSKLRFLQT